MNLADHSVVPYISSHQACTCCTKSPSDDSTRKFLHGPVQRARSPQQTVLGLKQSLQLKRACESLYLSTQGNYTKGDTLAGLFVVSASLFLSGHGAWQHFLAVTTEWVWNLLNTGTDPAETILQCSDMQQFIQ